MAEPHSLLDFKAHYAKSVNGQACPSGCRICAKQDADATGHASGTVSVPFDTYGEATE